MSSTRRQNRKLNKDLRSEQKALQLALKKIDAYYASYKDKSNLYLNDVIKNGSKYQKEAAKMILEENNKQVPL